MAGDPGGEMLLGHGDLAALPEGADLDHGRCDDPGVDGLWPGLLGKRRVHDLLGGVGVDGEQRCQKGLSMFLDADRTVRGSPPTCRWFHSRSATSVPNVGFT